MVSNEGGFFSSPYETAVNNVKQYATAFFSGGLLAIGINLFSRSFSGFVGGLIWIPSQFLISELASIGSLDFFDPDRIFFASLVGGVVSASSLPLLLQRTEQMGALLPLAAGVLSAVSLKCFRKWYPNL